MARSESAVWLVIGVAIVLVTLFVVAIGIARSAEAPAQPPPVKTEPLTTTEALALEAYQTKEAKLLQERQELFNEVCKSHKIEVADCTMNPSNKTISQSAKPAPDPPKAEEKK
jgi:hypothetical protein